MSEKDLKVNPKVEDKELDPINPKGSADAKTISVDNTEETVCFADFSEGCIDVEK